MHANSKVLQEVQTHISSDTVCYQSTMLPTRATEREKQENGQKRSAAKQPEHALIPSDFSKHSSLLSCVLKIGSNQPVTDIQRDANVQDLFARTHVLLPGEEGEEKDP